MLLKGEWSGTKDATNK